MKITKRLVSLMLILSMILTPVLAEVKIPDIENHWANATISKWVEKGLLSGNNNGLFRPDDAITRAEFISFIDAVVGFTDISEISFTDVSINDWYYDVVNKAGTVGLVNGYPGGEFRPNSKITREEVAVVISKYMSYSSPSSFEKLYSFSDGNDVSDWAKNGIANLVSRGYYSGYQDNTVKPKNNITRAEAVALLNNLFGNVSNDGETIGNNEVETVNGNITISKEGTVLQNTVLNGDLLITSGVADGEVYLDNVVLNGDVVIKGGGINSVYFNDVSVSGTLMVNKFGSDIRIVVSGTSEVKNTVLASGTSLVENELTGVGFESITVSNSVKGTINFDGSFTEVNLEAKNVTVNMIKDTLIDLITAFESAEGSKLVGEGTVKEVVQRASNITIESNATSVTVEEAGDIDAPSDIKITAVTENVIRIEIVDDSNAADEYDLSLFSISDKNGDNDISINSITSINGKVIQMKTEEMVKGTSYEFKVLPGFADEYGNKTTDVITETFVGVRLAQKIEVSPVFTNDGSYLTIDFNVPLGESAFDTSHYFINEGIGFPEKVVKISDDTVRLTIKRTNINQKYSMNMSYIKTSDGDKLDTSGKVYYFTGAGNTAINKLSVVKALDKQTIALFFNEKVDSIYGLSLDRMQIVGNENLSLNGAALVKYSASDYVYLLQLDPNYSSFDPASVDSGGLFTISFNGSDLDSKYDSSEFAPFIREASDLLPIKIDGVIAVDPLTVKIYFNQSVKYVDPSDISIDLDDTGSTLSVPFKSAVASNSDGTEWILGLSSPMASSNEINVLVSTNPNISAYGSGDYTIPFGEDTGDYRVTMDGMTYIYDVEAELYNLKEMRVDFPELMNQNDIENLNNYSINGIKPIKAVSYYPANGVMLTFPTEILDSYTDLVIKSGVENTSGTNFVNDRNNTNMDLTIILTRSYGTIPVLIDNVSVSGQSMVIDFNQLLKSNTNISTSNVLNLFDMTINSGNSTTSSAISSVVAKVDNSIVSNTTSKYFDSLIITFDTPLIYNRYGDIEFNSIKNSSDTLTGASGDKQDPDSRSHRFYQY